MAIKKEQAKKKLFSEEERTEWKKDITSDSMDIGSYTKTADERCISLF